MYIPTHFAEPRIEIMQALIRNYPLATLVCLSAEGLNANHIPLHLSDDGSSYGCLQGHIARANPLCSDFEKGIEVLVIFHAENAYISPSWYATKPETHKVVPTWNYSVVHVYGSMQIINDASWIRQHLEMLTTENEASFPEPWALSDAPHDFTERLIEQIVGIEIKISKMLGKCKQSQNQPAKNKASVMQGLNEYGKTELAKWVADCEKNQQE